MEQGRKIKEILVHDWKVEHGPSSQTHEQLINTHATKKTTKHREQKQKQSTSKRTT